MVLPDGIVEAIIATVPYGGGWGQIRGYLDAGGDVNDVTANGKTILILFLTTNDMEEEEHAQFVRFLIGTPTGFLSGCGVRIAIIKVNT